MKKQSRYLVDVECTDSVNTDGLYFIEERFGYNVYFFDADLIHLVRYAMSTDCVSEMSEAQLAFYTLYVEHMLNGTYSEPTANFSNALYRITSCMPLTSGVECGFSIDHSYVACT